MKCLDKACTARISVQIFLSLAIIVAKIDVFGFALFVNICEYFYSL